MTCPCGITKCLLEDCDSYRPYKVVEKYQTSPDESPTDILLRGIHETLLDIRDRLIVFLQTKD